MKKFLIGMVIVAASITGCKSYAYMQYNSNNHDMQLILNQQIQDETENFEIRREQKDKKLKKRGLSEPEVNNPQPRPAVQRQPVPKVQFVEEDGEIKIQSY